MGRLCSSGGMIAALRGPLIGAIAGFVLCLLSGIRGDIWLSSSLFSVGGRMLSEESSAEIVDLGKEEEEMEGGYHHELTISKAIMYIVLILILLTIIFEKTKELIEESAGRNMKPIITSLFGELTVLGFLSIFTFLVTKMGFFESLSVRIFGEEEAEELLEIFESVHYALFFVMVFFVLLVLLLVSEATKTEDELLEMDWASKDLERMQKLAEKQREDQIRSGSIFRYLKSCFVYVFPSLWRDSVTDQLHFYALKREFILERSVKPPFQPAAKENQVSEDFNFGRYLSVSLEHTLAHIVHLHATTWSCLAVFNIVFYFVIVATKVDLVALSWIWAGLGWLLFVMGNFFDCYLRSINQALVPVDYFPVSDSNTDPERQNILSEEGQTSYGDPLITNGSDMQLPPWCSIDLDAYLEKRSFFTRHFAKVTPNRHDALFWFERRGPHMCKLFFQTTLLFTAVYGGILVLTFLPTIYKHYDTATFLAYLIVSIMPVLLMRLERRHMAAQMNQVTSVGTLRRPQVVATIIREEKTARVVRAFIVLNKMQRLAEVGPEEITQGHFDAELLDSIEMKEVSKIFDSFDNSGDGKISIEDLRKIMSSLGAPTNDKNLRNMIAQLDQNSDGTISKSEFLSFYALNIIAGHETLSIDERAHQMFRMFDRSGDGEITLEEFKSALDAFDAGLHVDDVGELIRELDEDDKGTLGKHEFHHLLSKYEPLLKNCRPREIAEY